MSAAPTQIALADKEPVPALGDRARPQGRAGFLSNMGGGMVGWCNSPAGTYATYRAMRANPTVAIARMAAMAPIKGVEWSIVAEEDAPPNAKALIEKMLPDDVIRQLVRDMLFAFDYGHAPFESVWENMVVEPEAEEDDPENEQPGGQFWGVKKFKPLLVDITEILIEKAHGEYAGLRQGAIDFDPPNALLYTYDGEAGDLYGRSRFENIRKVVSKWDDLLERVGVYTKKVSGVTPVIRYPVGTSKDAGGGDRDNFDIAQLMLANLGKGNGIAWPTEFAGWAQDLIRAGADPEKLHAWMISFLEPKGEHSSGFDTLLRTLDAYIVRGYLVAERSILEGQYGTKAEATAHADFVLLSAEETCDDIASCINHGAIDHVLAVNFGERCRGCVKMVPAPLADDKQAYVRELVKDLITNPISAATIARTLDIDAMLDQAAVPRDLNAAETPNIVTTPGIPGAPAVPGQPGAPVPGQPQLPPAPGAPVVGAQVVADTAMNGAQVTAAKDIVVAAAVREIPRDSAVAMLTEFFKLDPTVAEKVVGTAGAGFESTANAPTAPAAPDAPTVKPGKGGDQPLTASLVEIMNAAAARMKKLQTA